MSEAYFVTGIGTGIGKTFISALLCNEWNADYWKPIQAGDLDNSDSQTVKKMTKGETVIHPEQYRLSQPLSPHASARIDGIKITLDSFQIPETKNKLIIEGAGGLLVPINDSETILDLVKHLNIPVIVVSQYYLGSINHTLLTLSALTQVNIPIAGIVFNGDTVEESKSIILKHYPVNIIKEVPHHVSR